MTPAEHRARALELLEDGYEFQYASETVEDAQAAATCALADEVGSLYHVLCALTHAVLALSADDRTPIYSGDAR